MVIDFDTMRSFISKIGPIVQEYAKQYGYKVASPIIAQACLESGYGTSYEAKFNNFFGLKYRNRRCPSAHGTFVSENDSKDFVSAYQDDTNQYFKFDTIEDGIRGYFEYLSVPKYDSMRNNITDPIEFINTLGKCRNCILSEYSNKIKRIINSHNLTNYDNINKDSESVILKQEESIQEEPVQEIQEKTIQETDNKKETKLEIGDKIKLLTNRYYNNKKIPSWIKKASLYFKGESENGWDFSVIKYGPTTGTVKKGMLEKVKEN